jgi:hypothetical protein
MLFAHVLKAVPFYLKIFCEAAVPVKPLKTSIAAEIN